MQRRREAHEPRAGGARTDAGVYMVHLAVVLQLCSCAADTSAQQRAATKEHGEADGREHQAKCQADAPGQQHGVHALPVLGRGRRAEELEEGAVALLCDRIGCALGVSVAGDQYDAEEGDAASGEEDETAGARNDREFVIEHDRAADGSQCEQHVVDRHDLAGAVAHQRAIDVADLNGGRDEDHDEHGVGDRAAQSIFSPLNGAAKGSGKAFGGKDLQGEHV